MRALARYVGVDPGYLFHIFKDQKKMNPKIAYQMGLYLGLNGEDLLDHIRPSTISSEGRSVTLEPLDLSI